MKRSQVYQSKLLKEIPLAFFERILQGAKDTYGRAHDMLAAELSSHRIPRGRGVIGSLILDEMFMAAAREAGLTVADRRVGKKNLPVPIISGQSIIVALARSKNPRACCRMSKYRKELVASNPTYVLPMAKYMTIRPSVKPRRGRTITFFLLHGPKPGHPDQLGFLQFAVIANDMKNIVWQMSVKDLIEISKQQIHVSPTVKKPALVSQKQLKTAQGETSGTLVSLRKRKRE